jgi:alkylhydroperoxidase family enzyme
MLAARLVGLPHGLRIDRILGIVVARIAAGDVVRHPPFELAKRRTGERVDVPWLQIAARRRARGARNQIAHDFGIDRLVEKPAARDAGIDGFEYIHEATQADKAVRSFIYYRPAKANAVAPHGANERGSAVPRAIIGLGVFLLVALPLRADDAPKAGAETGAETRTVSRLPALPDPSDPYLADMFAKIRAKGGQPLNIHLVQGFAPPLAKARLDMAYALRYDVTAPAPLRELAILRTGQILQSDYELEAHLPLARACGITDAQIAALPQWRTSDLFDARARAVLAYTEAIDRNGGDVDDATYAALAKEFSPREIVELTITIVTYYGTGQLTKALRVQPENDGRQSAPGKC